MYLLDYVYDVLSNGYFYVVFFLLLAYLLLKKRRPFLKEVIISSNLLSLITYLLFIIHSIFILYPLIKPFNDDRDIFFSYRIAGPYSTYYWLSVINSVLIFTFLLFKKHRNAVWITFWIVLSSAPFNYERLVIWITSLYRDYLPSSWSVYHTDFIYNYPWFAYLFVLAVTYIARKYFTNKKIKESANLQQ